MPVIDQKIAIVDPGLMELGGHHAALAYTICDYGPLNSVSFWGSQYMDQRLNRHLRGNGFNVSKHFAENFYHCFGDSQQGRLNTQTLSFIERVSVEYAEAFRQIPADTHIFIPCASWEHLQAIANALIISARQFDSLKICLMFNPGISHIGKLNLEPLAKRYIAALDLLSAFDFVHLYASDSGLLTSFNSLGNWAMSTHPCYLAKWDDLPKAQPKKNKHFVYFGDVKADKGFNKLPNILRGLISQNLPNAEFVVQFTHNWEIPELGSAIDEVKQLAELHSEITLDISFWDNLKIANCLATSEVAHQHYELSTYLHKSSGLDWWLKFYPHLQITPANLGLQRNTNNTGQPEDYFQNLMLWLSKSA